MTSLALDDLLDRRIPLLKLLVLAPTLLGESEDAGVTRSAGTRLYWSCLSSVDMVELQGVLHLPFAELVLVEEGGDVDVGLDAPDLGAVAVDPIELLDRELEGAHGRHAGAA